MRDDERGEIGSRTSAEDGEQLAPRGVPRGGDHEIGQPDKSAQGQSHVAVVSFVTIKPEVPDSKIGAKVADPLRKGQLRRLQIRLVRITSSPGGWDIDLGLVGRDIAQGTDADVEDVGVVLDNVPCPVAVVSVGVKDGKAADAECFPHVGNGDGHVVETAVAAKEVAPGMMSASTDERKGPIHFANTDFLRSLNHTSDGGPGRTSEGIPLDFRNESGNVDLEDEFV